VERGVRSHIDLKNQLVFELGRGEERGGFRDKRDHITPPKVRIRGLNLSNRSTEGWFRGGRMSQLIIAPPMIAP